MAYGEYGFYTAGVGLQEHRTRAEPDSSSSMADLETCLRSLAHCRDDTVGRIDIRQPQLQSWIIDLRGPPHSPVQRIQPSAVSSSDKRYSAPDFTLTADCIRDLEEALKGRAQLLKAISSRSLTFSGNLTKVAKLKNVFQSSSTSGSLPVDRSQWESDSKLNCSQCEARFTLFHRKHHCRFCGALCCIDCSRFRLGPQHQRACTLCHIAVLKARRQQSQQSPQCSNGSAGSNGTHQRLQCLEQRLTTLERARRERKAHNLLACVDVLIVGITVSNLLCGLMIGHYAASSVRSFAAEKNVHFRNPSQLPSVLSSMAGLDVYWLFAPLIWLATLAWTRCIVYRRSVHAFMIALVLLLTIEVTKLRTSRRVQVDKKLVWAEASQVYASYLRLAFFRLKGMYLKLGQYISARADVVPEVIAMELSQLQDCVPATTFARIRHTIEKALRNPLGKAFWRFDSEVVASASIAQVHKAILKDGTEVAVKVQHPDVAQLLSVDLWNMIAIFRIIGWLESDWDFSMVIESWACEVRRELDFQNEAENLRMANESIRASGVDVGVPQCIISSSTVIVMTWIPGVKICDPRAFPNAETADEDKSTCMRKICEVFAYGQYTAGFVHGDPHPGNILVGEGQQPVLLDWGLAKRVPEKVRAGNSRIVYSAWELDITGMLEGMSECGMPIDQIHILEDLDNIRFMMRNTAPGEESRRAAEQFVERFKERAAVKARGQRNQLRLVCPDLIILAKTTEMLQGLGSMLKTRVNYMHIMAAGAKRALLEEHWRKTPPLSPSGANVPFEEGPALSYLDSRIRGLLRQLLAEGHVTGVQCVIMQRGKMLCDTAIGMRSRLHPSRVTHDTLFCGFSLTKALLSIIAHILIDDKVLHYDTLLVDVQPELRGTGKDQITLRHILTHTSGLQLAFPSEATPQQLWRPQTGAAVISAAKPATPPGSKVSMHYFSFGWLLVPLLEKASGKSLPQLVKEKIVNRLGLGEHSMIMGSIAGTSELPTMDDERLATVEYDLRQIVAAVTEDLGGESAEVLAQDPGAGLLSLMGEQVTGQGGDESDGETVQSIEQRALQELITKKLRGREFLLDARLLNAKSLRATGGLQSLSGRFTARALARSLEGLRQAERSGSKTRLRSRVVPESADLVLSANGDNKETPSSICSSDVVKLMRAESMEDVPTFTRLVGREEVIRLAAGVQVFGIQQNNLSQPSPLEIKVAMGSPPMPNTSTRWDAFGHAGACGQLALCDPVSGLVCVVLSNKMPVAGQKNVGYEVLKLATEELGIGRPMPIW